MAKNECGVLFGGHGPEMAGGLRLLGQGGGKENWAGLCLAGEYGLGGYVEVVAGIALAEGQFVGKALMGRLCGLFSLANLSTLQQSLVFGTTHSLNLSIPFKLLPI